MPYIINRSNGTPIITLQDGTVDTSTSVGLVGRNYVGYGEIQNENFVFLLENFAHTTPPSRPIIGQTWFDTSTKALNVFTGQTWIPVNSAVVSETEPAAFTDSGDEVIGNGVIWFKSTTKQLYLFNEGEWSLIGPNALDGFGITNLVADTVLDTNSINQPVLKAIVDDTLVAIVSKNSFRISSLDSISGFLDISSGITFSESFSVTGNLIGNASTASRLETARNINGTPFSGSSDINITSPTIGSLSAGSYISGNTFNGSVGQEWSVDAVSENISNKVIVRDSNGDFSAGTITANVNGTLNGNVNVSVGTSKFNRIEATEFIGLNLVGNAFTATKLQFSKKINGVAFDGTKDITVPVSGMDVTGIRLSPSVVQSNLTSLGILNSLRVQDTGITLGNNNDVQFLIEQGAYPTLTINNTQGLILSISDTKQAGSTAEFVFMTSDMATAAGGSNDPALVGDLNSKTNLGLPTRTFGNVYAERFVGNADTATSASTADTATSASTADTATSASTADTALNAQLSTTQPQGTNNTTIATTAYVQQAFTSFVAVPVGIIAMWSGAVVNVPSGWAICDGANGTPDLRDRFVVGAGNAYAPGNVGGSDSVSLLTTNLPSHSHTGSTNAVSTDHTHAFNSTTELSGNHIHSITDPGHAHGGVPVLVTDTDRGGGSSNFSVDDTGFTQGSGTGISINSGGSHTHTVSGNTAGQSSTHAHSFTTDLTGNNSPIDVRPRYYALAYIMKT
jgi:hypothetical protein